MKITVAVASYNLADKIGRCIESLIAQDYEDLEILVVDDHSSDNSIDVVRALAEQHPERDIQVVLHKQNRGITQVRITAITEAKGECLFFVDADDIIETYTISYFYKELLESDAEVVCGSFKKVDEDDVVIREYSYPDDEISGDFALASYVERYAIRYFPIMTWNKLFRLDFLREHVISGAPDGHFTYGEDYHFMFLVLWHARKIAFLHKLTYHWVQHSKSSTNCVRTGRIDFQRIQTCFDDLFTTYTTLRFSDNRMVPHGLLYVLNTLLLTDGLLRRCVLSEVSNEEKKVFLRWFKEEYNKSGLTFHSIIGVYNRLSYLILMSPSPYLMFRWYYAHLDTIVKIVEKIR